MLAQLDGKDTISGVSQQNERKSWKPRYLGSQSFQLRTDKALLVDSIGLHDSGDNPTILQVFWFSGVSPFGNCFFGIRRDPACSALLALDFPFSPVDRSRLLTGGQERGARTRTRCRVRVSGFRPDS
jgi:hypothetical protein